MNKKIIMKTYHITKNGNQIGPYTEEVVHNKLTTGELNSNDLCWTEGMAQWEPLYQTIPLPATVPPPPPVSIPSQVGQSPNPAEQAQYWTQHQLNNRFINWIPALVLYCATSAISWIVELIELDGDEEAAGIFALIGLPVIILGVVFMSILHYKCWMALPQQHRFTTPGRAIGFLFIPFYNFYWAFVSWPKLSQGLINWQQSERIAPTDTRALAMSYAILFVCSLTIGQIPGLGILIGIAQVVIFIIYYLKVVGALNSMLKKP
jgi:hypothetical protein